MGEDTFAPGDRIVCIDDSIPARFNADAKAALAAMMVVGRTYTVETASDWRKACGSWSLTLVEAQLPDGLMSWDSSRFRHVEQVPA